MLSFRAMSASVVQCPPPIRLSLLFLNTPFSLSHARLLSVPQTAGLTPTSGPRTVSHSPFTCRERILYSRT